MCRDWLVGNSGRGRVESDYRGVELRQKGQASEKNPVCLKRDLELYLEGRPLKMGGLFKD